MARITYGSIATEINGSVGGQTFQKNAYGFTMKNKPNMARLQSDRQRDQHRRLDYVVKGWQQITQSDRDAWSAWALAHPVQSKHNPLAVLDGYGYWLKYNLMHTMWVSTYLQTPGAGVLTLPSLNPYLNLTGGVLAINTQPAVTAPLISYNLYMSPPIPPTRGYSDSFTRAIITYVVVPGNYNITTFYTNVFGSLPSVGDLVMVELQLWGGSIPYIFGSQKYILQIT